MATNKTDIETLIALVQKKLEGILNQDEQKVLESWSELSEENSQWLADIENTETIKKNLAMMDRFDEGAAMKRFQSKIKRTSNVRLIPMWLRVAAIIVLAFIGGSTIYYFTSNNTVLTSDVSTEEVRTNYSNAYLVIDGGEQISLKDDSTRIFDNNELIAKVDSGALRYENDLVVAAVQHHKVIVPERSDYHFTLPDGSKVWLNAGTRLEYQYPFGESSRELLLEGEMYIEVKKMPEKPMAIDTEYGKVVVTGTKFNLNSYEDEARVITTLVEGGVKYVDQSGAETMIKPGEQISVDKNTGEVEVKAVNTELYSAWKDGRFIFSSASLEKIMGTLCRWYAIECTFDTDELKNIEFSIDVKKYEDLSTILNMIETTDKVRFELDDNEVTIFQNN
jgi:transmembrane sensor